MKQRHRSGRGARRGGILFEVLLSIAVFAGAAGFILSATRSAIDAQQRSLNEQQASDLAASMMAELETGRINVSELREGLPTTLGSNEHFRADVQEVMDKGSTGWAVEIATQSTQFTGLTLVELTVYDVAPDAVGGAGPDDATVRITLRQLMKLREENAQEYEPDDLLRGLPTDTTGGGQP